MSLGPVVTLPMADLEQTASLFRVRVSVAWSVDVMTAPVFQHHPRRGLRGLWVSASRPSFRCPVGSPDPRTLGASLRVFPFTSPTWGLSTSALRMLWAGPLFVEDCPVRCGMFSNISDLSPAKFSGVPSSQPPRSWDRRICNHTRRSPPYPVQRYFYS